MVHEFELIKLDDPVVSVMYYWCDFLGMTDPKDPKDQDI